MVRLEPICEGCDRPANLCGLNGLLNATAYFVGGEQDPDGNGTTYFLEVCEVCLTRIGNQPNLVMVIQ
jgi:hypothetical protein